MAETGKNIMLGTAGHVDHGKTALVKLLTGCDTDRLAVEKERGLTIELGFAPCKMANERIVGIVDVPGHVDFIRNMVAGAHGIDVVIFVIAADDGVMPQTREHMDILTLLGVRRGIVALTKIDLIDAELREMLMEDVSDFLQGTFLEGAPVCGISNITGEGFDEFFTVLNNAVQACPKHETQGLFRMWIERKFSVHGYGTVVSGIPQSGSVNLGQKLTLQPDGATGRVRGLEVYGLQSESGQAGQCTAINLADVDVDKLTRGKVLCESESFSPANMIEAHLQILSQVRGSIKDYSEVHLHVGTAQTMCKIAMLSDAKQMTGGQEGFVQLRMKTPLSVAPGERFVIRSSVRGLADGRVTTLGGGRIISASDKRLRRNRPWLIESLESRLAALDSAGDRCEIELIEKRSEVNPRDIARMAQLKPDEVEKILAQLISAGKILTLAGGSVVHLKVMKVLTEQIVDSLEKFHAENPKRGGVRRDELVDKTQTSQVLIDLAIRSLLDEKIIEQQGNAINLVGKGAVISQEDRKLYENITSALQTGGIAPPVEAELVESYGESADRVRTMLQLLIDQGMAVRLNEKIVMHIEGINQAKNVVLEMFAKQGRFESKVFRDLLGASRKYAIPLLDYFDTVRLTVRSGSWRTPGKEAKKT